MVPIGVNNTSEIVPDAEPEQREHVSGEPRLIKYLPTGDYTPNLFTICQAINGAREALLMRSRVQMSYGQDAEWWRGHAIALSKIVNVDDGAPAQPEADRQDELLAEVQRLIAFLSASTRSYAAQRCIDDFNAQRPAGNAPNNAPPTGNARYIITAGDLTALSFTITATPTTVGGQNLHRCGTMTVNHAAVRTPADCWN